MRSPYEALVVIRACAVELDPGATRNALYERLKGGLPGSSMSDGRGASEPAMPELDAEDAQIIETLEDLDRRIDQLASDALELRKIQRDVLYRQWRPAPIAKAAVYAKLDLEPDGRPPEKPKWCLSCSRVKGHFCPIAKPKRGGKDGVLCNWCINHRDGDGWPPLEHVQAHAEGRPVRVKVKR